MEIGWLPMVKGWTRHGFQFWPSARGHKGTWHNQGSPIIYITEKTVRNNHLSEHAQSTTFGLLVEASVFRLTSWFHIHFFLFI